MKNKYCESLNRYSRFKTREVYIGDVPLGGQNPIRIQSMTTTDTMDVVSTVYQAIKIVNAGSDYVRITTPSIKSVRSLEKIKKKLYKKGYKVPLIADIHFTPNAAIEAAKIVEKIRINPGNYADKKKFESFEYSDFEYKNELERIYKRFSPLVDICKNNNTAMRIGVNHGSLSDRILNRYGDTPKGMVESAMEFLRICEDRNYHSIVISMKSSNPIVMVHAYRLLVNQMLKENMNYPLHLGVTEAGEGLDGRVKSAVGIGSLLEDGLGDTIRVSLTEEPECEIPVAKMILKRYENKNISTDINIENLNPIDPFTYSRKSLSSIDSIGKDNVPKVIVDARKHIIDYEFLSKIGYVYIAKNDKWHISDLAADYIIANDISFNLPPQLKIILPFNYWKMDRSNTIPLMTLNEYINNKIDQIKILHINTKEVLSLNIKNRLLNDNKVVFMIESDSINNVLDKRNYISNLFKMNISAPIIIYQKYDNRNKDVLQIDSSVDVGSLLVDGLVDGIFLDIGENSVEENLTLLFKILQATRSRITKTEFISCPSCGRTQFDLIETSAMVREKTAHLKGLKIAVMGCIVNGPGEMADADYGYVGTGVGLISLYKKHNIIKRNIPKEDSVNELIELIRKNGDWVDPPI